MSLAAALQPFIDDNDLAGAVMLVARKDSLVAVESVGYADREAKRPMTDDALFWIASMTKPMVATVLMMLVEEGKLSLDDTVEQYIPAFKGQMMVGARSQTGDIVTLVKSPRPFTIREAFSHTSGMPFFSRPEVTIDLFPLDVAAMSYAMSPLEFAPGTKYQYGNCGINSVGRVMEIVTGQRFDVLMRERLLDPLGMTDTTFVPTSKQLERLAETYRPNKETGTLERTPIVLLRYPLDDTSRQPCPGGGLFSTARDCMRFGQMILSGGTFEGRRYLSPASIRTMTTTQTGDLKRDNPANPEDGYGIGWSTTRRDPGNTDAALLGVTNHGGALGTNLAIDPEHGLVMLYLHQRPGYPNDNQAQVLSAFQAAARELAGKKN